MTAGNNRSDRNRRVPAGYFAFFGLRISHGLRPAVLTFGAGPKTILNDNKKNALRGNSRLLF
jgi:hypothetical protein